MLNRFRLRGKIVILLLIPLVAVVALTGAIVLDRAYQASRATATADRVLVATRVSALTQDIQQEMLLSIGFLFRGVGPPELSDQRQQVNNARFALLGSDAPAVPDSLRTQLNQMTELAGLRAAIDAGTKPAADIVTGYTGVVTRLIDGIGLESTADLSTPEGRQAVALHSALRIDEHINIASSDLLIVAGAKERRAITPYFVNLGYIELWVSKLGTYGTPEQVQRYQQVRADVRSRLGNAVSDPNADPSDALLKVPFPVLLNQLKSAHADSGNPVIERIVLDANNAVDDRRRQVLVAAFGVGGGSVLVLLLALFLSLSVARGVVRPLSRLTTSAEMVARVAQEELTRVADDEVPVASSVEKIKLDAVGVHAKDEIGELARAFHQVQRTAAGLVERQVVIRRNVAEMFGHVGRRTQNLVGRQIELIDELERRETDEGRLQNLYRLDHVSSRLRRNASSLVVLSGVVDEDESDHTSPLALPDVVRLALAEIEDYARVDVRVPADIEVKPEIVPDLILVVAELMENATSFSPPHTRVTVTAERDPYGLRLSIIDNGIGMSDDKRARENARLRRRERLDLAPTGVLGLFVVGRLARRHEMRVDLTRTPQGGTTATVQVPGRMLVSATPRPQWSALSHDLSRLIATSQPWSGFAIAGESHRPGRTAQDVKDMIEEFEGGVTRARNGNTE